MQEFPRKADWISFVLHFVFGFVVGCILGFLTITRRSHGVWLREEVILPYLIGTSLISAGLGAKWGDQLWIGDHYKVIPPNAPTHSRLSLLLAHLSVLLGAVAITAALYWHFSHLLNG